MLCPKMVSFHFICSTNTILTKLVNTSKSCIGMFTRIHKYRQEIKKSALEYVFVSSDLEEHFREVSFFTWREAFGNFSSFVNF